MVDRRLEELNVVLWIYQQNLKVFPVILFITVLKGKKHVVPAGFVSFVCQRQTFDLRCSKYMYIYIYGMFDFI